MPILHSKTSFNKEKRVFPNTISLLIDGWPTPLVRLETECNEKKEVWAKLEFYNAFSKSVKDRPVWNMLIKALEEGSLRHMLEEATSGNVGISLACLSNIFGLKFTAYVPKPTPRTTEILLKILGANVIRTEYQTIDRRFWTEVSEHAKQIGATNLNQFENDANFEIHYETTAREIVEQLESIGRTPDFVIAGIGTSGHIAAISKRLKNRYGDQVKIIGVQPAPGSSIPGIKRVETEPKWLSMVKVDKIIDISWEEAVEGVIEVARREGLLIGLSSGAVFQAYKKLSENEGVFVLVFPDDGFKYVEHFERYLRLRGIKLSVEE
ncbi:MAG: cysteine synthase [Thermoprotei archaeon]|nr:MAG: cysteine synthase [Thermoprotei archaeon]RLF22472.1 MAG: cysteine synthase [Thermoprotei archaeon]